jgi:hypothetical protein
VKPAGGFTTDIAGRALIEINSLKTRVKRMIDFNRTHRHRKRTLSLELVLRVTDAGRNTSILLPKINLS